MSERGCYFLWLAYSKIATISIPKVSNTMNSSYVLIKTPPSVQGSEQRYSHPIGSPGKYIILSWCGGSCFTTPDIVSRDHDFAGIALSEKRTNPGHNVPRLISTFLQRLFCQLPGVSKSAPLPPGYHIRDERKNALVEWLVLSLIFEHVRPQGIISKLGAKLRWVPAIVNRYSRFPTRREKVVSCDLPEPCPLEGMPCRPGVFPKWWIPVGRGLLKIEDTHPDTPDGHVRRFRMIAINSSLADEKPLYGLLGASQGQARREPLPIFGEPPPVGTTAQAAPDQGTDPIFGVSYLLRKL